MHAGQIQTPRESVQQGCNRGSTSATRIQQTHTVKLTGSGFYMLLIASMNLTAQHATMADTTSSRQFGAIRIQQAAAASRDFREQLKGGNKQADEHANWVKRGHTSSVSSSRLTRTRMGSVMNFLVISRISFGIVADTTTTCKHASLLISSQHVSRLHEGHTILRAPVMLVLGSR